VSTRLSVNINDETAAFLRSRAAAEGRTVTEIVRRMSGLYEQVVKQVESGAQVQFEQPNGSITVVTLL
jgi:plasmid stability protein